MSNWTDYVKQYALQRGITYGEALKKAAPSYRKSRGGVVLGGKKKSRRSKSKMPMKKMGGSKVSSKRKKSRIPKRKVGGSKVSSKHKKAYSVGKGLGEMFGGVNKKALTALLSGLDAGVKIR